MLIASSSGLDIFDRFSSFSKLVGTIRWIKRFTTNCKAGIQKNFYGCLKTKEIEDAEILLLIIIQSESFIDSEGIKHLEPFRDEKGLLRIKSKINLREDTYNFRFPIILPHNHAGVKLLVKDVHEKHSHAGVGTVLAVLREEFWILKGRRVVGAVIKKCVTCRRHDAKSLDALPAPLPLERVRDAAPFEILGVDLAGPIYLKGGKKSWVCIFTCAVYRAVHFELLHALSTPSFLMALRRHIGRRGRPSVIFSDHGKNFEGLNNRLERLNFKKLFKDLARQKIEWRFNPPSAPWWGGFWERLIGILKKLLRRVLKRSCLSYEEMLTVLIDCESVMNSRPITFVSDNEHEYIPLTPSHFLHEIKEVGVLDLDNIEGTALNKRYVYRQKIKDDLRRRFRSEYLGALSFQKRRIKSENIVNVGDIVLVGSDNKKRVDWPLARVKSVIFSRDGVIRVVRLITSNGELVRPIQRIYPLELNFNTPEERAIVSMEGNKNNCCMNEPGMNDVVKNVVTRSGRRSNPPQRFMY